VIRAERIFRAFAVAIALTAPFGARALAADGKQDPAHRKVDRELNRRAGKGGTSRVIVTLKPGTDAANEITQLGGRMRRSLGLIHGHAIELPNSAIRRLADHPAVEGLHYDRPTTGTMNRTAVAVGARAVRTEFGYTGAGVGIALIDSGVTSWHNDLTPQIISSAIRTKDGKRVAESIDFVNGESYSYDDNGHGTHVAGIIVGNGLESAGAYAGIAPAAHLLSLKVLDEEGKGVISDVIAALKWVLDNRPGYNIRVVNMSVGAAVTESYMTDPLARAVKRVVDAGVVVVCAAGNRGMNAQGQIQYGGITAPANAPWVLTVGAYSHQGTVSRSDDVMASYSSRGPTPIDFAAKPDVVAPGTGTVSLADASSLLYALRAGFLLAGQATNPTKQYLSLSGTSMAAPVVSGTVALMMQANPSLTPNMVKAIIQYTAQKYDGYHALTQGAGFINTYGAVQLARFFRTATAGSSLSIPQGWSKQIIWGNRRITGGVIRPNANAFQMGTTWGTSTDRDGENVVWGTLFGDNGENIVWGTFDTLGEDHIVWGTQRDADGENIVWGTYHDGENIVWGTTDDVENIVWGTDCGGSDCENIVWGTRGDGENIVWGTAEDAENIVWGTDGDVENIVWGTSGDVDDITWGTGREHDDPTCGNRDKFVVLFDDPNTNAPNFDQTPWKDIFPVDVLQLSPATVEVPVTTVVPTSTSAGGF
jgi:serine protease AprX